MAAVVQSRPPIPVYHHAASKFQDLSLFAFPETSSPSDHKSTRLLRLPSSLLTSTRGPPAEEIFLITRPPPGTKSLPLIFDSPHSGEIYPPDFEYTAPLQVLATAADSYVDDLYRYAPKTGGSLLAAQFPRSYIDVNRAPDDLDPTMLSCQWPGSEGALHPGPKTELGIGVVRRLAVPGVPVYSRMLAPEEVAGRLEYYYDAYHGVLERLITAAQERWGQVWLVDCHSMKAMGNAATPDGPVPRPDVSIGDRGGTSCAPEFTEMVASAWRSLGYEVWVNRPYQGGRITQIHGHPDLKRHALQVELNRKLYMDEATRIKHNGYPKLQADITIVAGKIAEFVRRQLEMSGKQLLTNASSSLIGSRQASLIT